MRDDGEPTTVASATYAVVDLRYSADDAAHTVESGSATVDTLSTTISAAGGRGTSDPRQVTVASATGITVGRRYLLQSGGRSEVVRVSGISSTTIRLSAPALKPFPSGASFLGVELSATVTLATCATEAYLDEPNSLAIRWTPSGYRPYLEAIHLERLAPAPLIAPDELLKLDATLAAYFDDNMSAADALQQAVEDFNVDMNGAGVDDDEILAGPTGRSALKYRAAWHILKSSSEPSAVTRAERYHARWQELVASLLQGWDKKKTARLTADVAKEPPDVRSRFAVRW
jgi:hypothetical protein